MELALLIASALFSTIALVASGVSLWLRVTSSESPEAVQRRLQETTLAVADLTDRVDHWMRRDRVRNTREGQAAAAERVALNGTDKKALLRARAREQGLLR